MKKITVIALIGIMLLSVAFIIKKPENNRTADEVLSEAKAKYDMQAYIIGEDPYTIDIDLYNEKDKDKVEKYLTENLTNGDLEKYTIKLYSEWNEIN